MQKVLMGLTFRVDKYRIFAVPVSLESVPDYDQYVKNPMDFATMQSKLDNFEYLSLDDFSVIFKINFRMTYTLFVTTALFITNP